MSKKIIPKKPYSMGDRVRDKQTGRVCVVSRLETEITYTLSSIGLEDLTRKHQEIEKLVLSQAEAWL